jgi:hypothetical protein
MNSLMLRILPTLLGCGLLASIWLPIVAHFHVGTPTTDRTLIEALRTEPSDDVFRRSALSAPLLPVALREGDALLAEAERLAAITTFDHHQGVMQLGYASFEVPDTLVRAYAHSGQSAYLARAASFIESFARYEERRWLDRGFLWNDHAIAERVGVLARFWHAYRRSPVFEARVAEAVVRHVMRATRYLARADHFTVATNHGIMQNIALLQAATAFPRIPEAGSLAALAVARLDEQYAFLISSEGVVLEHSAGYHKAGLHMLGTVIELMGLNGIDVPLAWKDLLARGIEFETLLRRPDGTLPAFGDTDYDLPATVRPRTSDGAAGGFSIFPVSGYAIWTKAGPEGAPPSHTVATWAYHKGLGHKLADEMSLLTWGAGRTWITNTGYWPYSDSNRLGAQGWLNGNAPHWSGEPRHSNRRTEVEGYAAERDVVALGLRRSGGDGGSFDRQIVTIGASTWLVVDSAQAQSERTAETLWTFAPDLVIEPAGAFGFRASNGADTMHATFRGVPDPDVTRFLGSIDPLAGWIAGNHGITAAPALRIRASGPASHTFALFEIGPGAAPATAIETRFDAPDAWQLRVSRGGRVLAVERAGRSIRVQDDGTARTLRLSERLDVATDQAMIEATAAAAAARYPRYRELDFYRTRLSALVVFGLVIQEPAFFAMRRFGVPPSILALLRVTVIIAWIALTAWALFVYLA